MDHDTREGLEHVEAELNYLVDTGEKPVIYLYPPPPGIPQQTGRYTTATVSIRAGRTRFTTHTAFDDPTALPHAVARESIEIRTLIFF